MKKTFPILLKSNMIGGLLILFTACQENILYHSYQPINHIGWYKNDTLAYRFHSDSCSQPTSSLQIGIRHTDAYKYRDIWLALIPILKDSISSPPTDTLHLYLADSTGNWKGKGIGEVRLFTQTVQHPSLQNSTETLLGYRLIHLMKDQPLKEIKDIGICIYKEP